MRRNGTLVIVAAGLILAGLGVTAYADSIVEYVVRIVDRIAWGDIWRPVHDPPPMETDTYRPLTVVMVKALLWVTGRDVISMTLIHVLALPWLALATRRFLRAHGLAEVATPAALTTIALPAMLFAAWIPVESDGLGAAFCLEAGALLQLWRRGGRRRDLILFGLAAFGAATTKETSAAALFGYLLSASVVHRREDPRLWRVLLAYGAGLAVLVTPLLLTRSQHHHPFFLAADRVGFLLLHDLGQIAYLLGAAGCLLVFLLAAPRWRWLGFGAAALLLCIPPTRVYNHYESVILDRVLWFAPLALLAVGALVRLAISGPPDRRVLALTTLFLFATLVAAPVLAPQTRPDVSARLFAPVIPILHGLAWLGVRRWWPRARAATALLAGVHTLFVAFGAYGMVRAYRARMAIEDEAKAELVTLLRTPGVHCPVVIATNRDHELSVEELMARGAPWPDCSALFVPNYLKHDPPPADFQKFKLQGHTYSLRSLDLARMQRRLRGGRPPSGCVLLYVQTARARFETEGLDDALSGDFAWAFGRMPEFDEFVHTQQVRIQFQPQTDYEKHFRRAGAAEVALSRRFEVLPFTPTDAIRRLLAGWPVVESYNYEVRLLHFTGLGCVVPEPPSLRDEP